MLADFSWVAGPPANNKHCRMQCGWNSHGMPLLWCKAIPGCSVSTRISTSLSNWWVPWHFALKLKKHTKLWNFIEWMSWQVLLPTRHQTELLLGQQLSARSLWMLCGWYPWAMSLLWPWIWWCVQTYSLPQTDHLSVRSEGCWLTVHQCQRSCSMHDFWFASASVWRQSTFLVSAFKSLKFEGIFLWCARCCAPMMPCIGTIWMSCLTALQRLRAAGQQTRYSSENSQTSFEQCLSPRALKKKHLKMAGKPVAVESLHSEWKSENPCLPNQKPRTSGPCWPMFRRPSAACWTDGCALVDPMHCSDQIWYIFVALLHRFAAILMDVILWCWWMKISWNFMPVFGFNLNFWAMLPRLVDPVRGHGPCERSVLSKVLAQQGQSPTNKHRRHRREHHRNDIHDESMRKMMNIMLIDKQRCKDFQSKKSQAASESRVVRMLPLHGNTTHVVGVPVAWQEKTATPFFLFLIFPNFVKYCCISMHFTRILLHFIFSGSVRRDAELRKEIRSWLRNRATETKKWEWSNWSGCASGCAVSQCFWQRFDAEEAAEDACHSSGVSSFDLGSTKYRKMQRHHETSKKDIEKDRKICRKSELNVVTQTDLGMKWCDRRRERKNKVLFVRGTEKTALQKYVIVCLGAEGFCENFEVLQLDLDSEVGLPGAGHVPQMTIMDIHGHSIKIHGFFG